MSIETAENNAKSRILIVGCGQLGSRHLQAVATLPFVNEIEVVDERPEALQLGKERLAEIQAQDHLQVRWLNSLKQARSGGDLCIVATQAAGRCELVRSVAERLGFSRFLVEKLVAQTTREYEELIDFSRKNSLRVWVNCKTRAHAAHRRVKQHLSHDESFVLCVAGGNHGLANNGVHAVDLFSFFDGTDKIDVTGSHIDSVLHPSKRGSALFDLSGTIHARSQKGSIFTLSLAGDHMAPLQFSVVSSKYRAMVDDQIKCFYESDAETGWAWRQVPYDSNLAVSSMTRDFATGILTREQCELPTLQECFTAHRIILETLRPHFNRILGKKTDECPVT